MRIAQLTQDWSATGGVGRYVRDLVDALGADGHEVRVIHAGSGPPEPGCESVPGFTAWTPEAVASARAATVMEALDRFAPDVVHVQSNNNFALEAAIQRRYSSLKTLHVYDFCPSGNKYHHALGRACRHATGPLCVPRMVYKRCVLDKRPTVLWRAYRRTTAANRSNAGSPALIVASDYVRRAAMASGYPPAQVHHLPYFTVPPPNPPPATAARTILFSGRVVREKGLHVLLAALTRVPPPWRLLVAGDGMDRPRTERIASRLGVAGRVVFLGWLDHAAVVRCHEEAAVVVVPSLWPEPFGIVGLEAMACARPVVAFDVGGVSEWLADGETGSLVPPHDVAALGDRIAALLADPGLAAAMGGAGRVRVEREFSAPSHVNRLLAIYRGTARGEGPAA